MGSRSPSSDSPDFPLRNRLLINTDFCLIFNFNGTRINHLWNPGIKATQPQGMIMRPKKAEASSKLFDMKLAELLRQRETQFEILGTISAMISRSESLEKGLGEALGYLVNLTGADIGTVHSLNPVKNELELLAGHGVSENFKSAERCIPMGDCLCGEAAQTGNLIQSFDLQKDARLTRLACNQEKFGSVIGVPLKSGERVIGVFTVYARRPFHFTGADMNLLTLIGNHIGQAIENAKRYAQSWERAVFQERAMIAREIHDGIAQSLAFLNLQTRNLEAVFRAGDSERAIAELDRLRSEIMGTYDDVRQLMADFRGGFKPEDGFVNGVSILLQEFTHRTGIQTCFDIADPHLHLSPSAEVQLFRIIQEALCNVRKHASARLVRLNLASDSHRVRLTIEDDGKGFEPDEIAPLSKRTDHFGLEIMRERTLKIGGILELISRPGGGTTLAVTFPLEQQDGMSG